MVYTNNQINDNIFVKVHTTPSLYHTCDTGKCIPASYISDIYPDCPVKPTDEKKIMDIFKGHQIEKKSGMLQSQPTENYMVCI